MSIESEPRSGYYDPAHPDLAIGLVGFLETYKNLPFLPVGVPVRLRPRPYLSLIQ